MTESPVVTRSPQAVARSLFRRLFRSTEKQPRTLVPFRPNSQDEVPAEAWSALERTCGTLTLERLLVMPGTWRGKVPRGLWGERARILAFGAEAVGHWTDDGEAGAVESVPIGDILAIDDRLVLLDGRLSLIGKAARITVRYNAVARPQLRDSVLWLRRRIAGPEFATRGSFVWIGGEGDERPEAELPHKWAYMLAHRDDLRIDPPPASEMIAVGDVVEIGRSKGPATGIALLGQRELVVAAEPSDWLYLSRYGVDLTVVPRCYLRDVGWSRGDLCIRLTGQGAGDDISISRPLDERLFAAMRRSFGDAVTWA